MICTLSKTVIAHLFLYQTNLEVCKQSNALNLFSISFHVCVSQVAAIDDSAEFRLGIRLNAKMDQGKYLSAGLLQKINSMLASASLPSLSASCIFFTAGNGCIYSAIWHRLSRYFATFGTG